MVNHYLVSTVYGFFKKAKGKRRGGLIALGSAIGLVLFQPSPIATNV